MTSEEQSYELGDIIITHYLNISSYLFKLFFSFPTFTSVGYLHADEVAVRVLIIRGPW